MLQKQDIKNIKIWILNDYFFNLKKIIYAIKKIAQDKLEDMLLKEFLDRKEKWKAKINIL